MQGYCNEEVYKELLRRVQQGRGIKVNCTAYWACPVESTRELLAENHVLRHIQQRSTREPEFAWAAWHCRPQHRGCYRRQY